MRSVVSLWILAACAPPAPEVGVPHRMVRADGPALAGSVDDVVQGAMRRPLWVPDGSPSGGAWVHAVDGLRARMGDRATLEDAAEGAWSVDLELVGYGRKGSVAPVAAPTTTAWDTRVTLDRGPVVEWYEHVDAGLEQGFTLAEAPPGDGPIALELDVRGDLHAVSGSRDVSLVDVDGVERVRVTDLVVVDAEARELPAWYEVGCDVGSCTVTLAFDAEDAAFPVVVDPIYAALLVSKSNIFSTTLGYAGYSVDVTDNWAIVGIPGDPSAINLAGSAMVLRRNQVLNDDSWVIETTLDTGALGFGWDVAIDGDIAVVGAPLANSASIYQYDGTDFVLANTIISPFGGRFGHSVAVDGGRVVVGEPLNSSVATDAGSVWVYERSVGSAIWDLETELDQGPTQADANFGGAVAIDGDLIAATAPGPFGAWYGRATVFRRAGPGSWDRAHVVDLAGDPFVVGFGTDVALEGNTMAVSAPQSVVPGGSDPVGQVMVWSDLDAPSLGPWRTIAAPDTSTDFGQRIAMNDSVLVVSSVETLPNSPSSRVWLFDVDTGSPIAALAAATAAYPSGVAVSDSLMIVGGPEVGTHGAVKLFRLQGDFVVESSFTPGVPAGVAAGAQAGSSVALWADYLAVGLATDDTVLSDAGSVVLMRRDPANPNGWTFVTTVVPSAPQGGAEFGQELAMADGWLVVGAPLYGANDPGRAYLFDVDDPTAEVAFVTGIVANANLGKGVAVDANWLVLGSPGVSRVEAYNLSAATVSPGFALPAVSLLSAGGASSCGEELALGGRWIMVGCPLDDVGGADAGAFRTFDVASGVPTLVHSVGGTLANGRLGRGLAVLADTVFVGEPGASSDSGVVHRYVWDGTFTEKTPTIGGGALGDGTGYALAASGDRLVVGSDSDRVMILERNRGGVDAWASALDPVPVGGASPSERYGSEVAIAEGNAIVGSPGYSSNAGRVTFVRLDTALEGVTIEDWFTGDEDTVLVGNVLLNDFDPNGDALQAYPDTSPAEGGVFTLSPSGDFTWAPPADFNGQSSFTYTLGGLEVGTVTLDVVPVNDAPVAFDDVHYAVEDTPYVAAYSVLSTAYDIEGDDIDVVVTTPPTNGVLSMDGETGDWSYQAAPDYFGYDFFEFEPFDGLLSGAPVRIEIEVTAVNDPPVGQDWVGETDEDVPLSVAAPGLLSNASDVENDPLFVSIVQAPAFGVLVADPATGAFTYSPLSEAHGVDSFRFAISDGVDLTEYDGTITINEVNDPPVGVDDVYQITEDGTLITVAGSDDVLSNDTDIDLPVGGTLSALLTSAPAYGVLSFSASGAFTYTPNPNFNGVDTFRYQLCDTPPVGLAQECVSPVVVQITVTPVNDPPVVVDWSGSTDEDVVLDEPAPGLLAGATDADGDTLTVNVVPVIGPGNGGLVISANGHFVYTPNAGFSGADGFVYTVSDGTVGVIATASITVNSVNDAPVAIDDSFAVDEDSSTAISAPGVVFNDLDEDDDILDLTVLLLTPPANGVITNFGSDGSFEYSPNTDFNGPDTFTYEVRDPSGAVDQGLVTIDVAPINDAPVAVDDSYVSGPAGLDEDSFTGVIGNDVDVDGDLLTASVVGAPAHGLLELDPDGAFRYTPDLGYLGDDAFTYTLSDGLLTSNTATVDLVVESGTGTGGSGTPGTGTGTGTGTGGDTGCVPRTWYPDADGDGYGADTNPVADCGTPPGMVEQGGDCDDGDATVYPGAEEFANDGIDQDCDGDDAVIKGDDGGCGCVSGGGRGPAGLWLGAVVVAALLRRRAG